MLKKSKPGSIFLIYIIIAAILIFAISGINRSPIDQIDYSEFLNLVDSNNIERVIIEDTGKIDIILRSGEKYQTYFPNAIRDEELARNLTNKSIKVKYQQGIGSSWWFNILGYMLPIFIIIIFWFWLLRPMMRGGGKSSGMNFGKNPAKTFDPTKGKITFDNVAGIDESKEELMDIVSYLKNSEEFDKLGARMPKGILLVGPPGTGKTLTARAIAGEANVPFFYISGSDFVELFVGVGASRVRDLFKNAKAAGSAIIFIDELDAVGRQRGAGLGGGHDEREQTLNQLLVEMDGFEPGLGVIIMAATNRPDVLDRALLRPGRFDKKVVIDAPDAKGREEILKIHIKGKKISPDIDLKKLAKSTPGFVGADLENLVNEAALFAMRNKRKFITQEDCEESIERVIAGPSRKSRILSKKEKEILAYHELGHAFMGFYLDNTDPIHKITIIPRGHAALGYTLQIPEQDKYLLNRSELLDRITYALGGRAAEKLIFSEITTGAGDDLKKATKLAKNMVTKLGMSDKIGPLSWDDSDDEVFLGRELGKSKSYSEETANIIDNEIKNIINERFDIALDILKNNKERLELATSYLLVKENISGEEFEEIMKKDLDSLKEFVEKYIKDEEEKNNKKEEVDEEIKKE